MEGTAPSTGFRGLEVKETGPLAMAADNVRSRGVTPGSGSARTRDRFQSVFPRQQILRSQAALCSFFAGAKVLLQMKIHMSGQDGNNPRRLSAE